jgi:glycosyltransferase involved in cell wall biosynthesis
MIPEGRTSDTPRLAVVIPCYNYVDFVGRAIASVTSQDCRDYELVVIDDGSTDASWSVIEGSGVPAFRISNRGARNACLFGLEKTTAPFVLFLDADDELCPNAIKAIIDRLDPEVSKLQFSLEKIDANGEPLEKSVATMDDFRSRGELAQRVRRTGIYRSPPTSGNVFRRDLCEFLREATYDQFVDGVMLFAAPFVGDVVSTSEVLGRYRIHDRNDSGLGRAPDASLFERDLRRFEQRINHLKQIVQRLEARSRLVDPKDTFYHRERSFCSAIASGVRPKLRALPGMLSLLMGETYSWKNKIAVGTFLVVGSFAKPHTAQASLAYRFKSDNRSAAGFLKAILGTR